jgi:AraC-like DNA-binding protein/streptogramin lyase
MKGNLLFGTREKGVFKFRDGTFSRFEIEGLNRNHLINGMYEDRDGTLWIATNEGLFRVKEDTVEIYAVPHGLSSHYTITVMEDDDGNLWVGTLKGLNRMKKYPSSRIGFERLLDNNIVTCLFEDMENNLWIGTDDSGIRRLKNSKFATYAPMANKQEDVLFSVYQDKKGDTWIGSLNGTLHKCRGDKYRGVVEIAKAVGISAIEEDDAGNLWVGTCGKGLFRRKGDLFINFTTKDGLADNVINSIYCDSNGTLWFAANGGVSLYRGGDFESYGTADGVRGKIVSNVYEDKSRHILLATAKGLHVIKNGIVTKDNVTVYLKDIPVFCVLEETMSPGENAFWIATDGVGLNRLMDGNIVSYTKADGMSSNTIYQLLEDEGGNLWMTSDGGVLRVSKKELNDYANGSIDKVYCTSFGISDGMKSTEFYNFYSRNSVLKNRKGEFLFVTKKGISVVEPGKIKINKLPPPVTIERIYFNGRPIPIHSMHPEKRVFKGIGDFVFVFTAPSFLSPEKIKFKYKLEGVDVDWIYLQQGGRRLIRYRKCLEPGTYTFRVTACNNDGLWNREGASVTFTLKPFFYETLIFKLTVLLFFLSLAAGGYWMYKKRPFKKRGKYKSSPLHPLFVDECLKKLNYLMAIKEVYRDETISLHTLSEKLSVKPHQLSQIINEKLHKNFPDFINTYRVEKAKQLLRDPKQADQKIIAIAFEVGFNTKVAFNNAFKKHTGMTPSEYRRNGGPES